MVADLIPSAIIRFRHLEIACSRSNIRILSVCEHLGFCSLPSFFDSSSEAKAERDKENHPKPRGWHLPIIRNVKAGEKNLAIECRKPNAPKDADNSHRSSFSSIHDRGEERNGARPTAGDSQDAEHSRAINYSIHQAGIEEDNRSDAQKKDDSQEQAGDGKHQYFEQAMRFPVFGEFCLKRP